MLEKLHLQAYFIDKFKSQNWAPNPAKLKKKKKMKEDRKEEMTELLDYPEN